MLHDYQEKTSIQIRAANLFDERPTLCFKAEQTCCPIDNEPLHIYKTAVRTVKALGIGTFKAHQTISYCKNHADHGVFTSHELAELVPTNSNVSYSVMAEVGKLRYLEHRQVKEIGDILVTRHAIRISRSEIELLIEKFVFYLSAVHQQSNHLIRAQIEAQGGYILHLDATCEGDSPKLLSSVDSVSGFVLYSVKVSSENADELRVFLEQIKTYFGVPHAAVSDMSKAIQAAVLRVFGDIPHYICHFHFMAAIGKLLFENEHKALYRALSKEGISGKLNAIKRDMPKSFTNFSCDDLAPYIESPKLLGHSKQATDVLVYCVVLWILDHPSEGNGYGFPFDQRYLNFYERLQTAFSLLEKVTGFYPQKSQNDVQVWKVYHLIKNVIDDSKLKNTVAQYKEKQVVFTELRNSLGVAPESTAQGLRQNSQSNSEHELKKIKTAVESFTAKHEMRINNTADKSIRASFEKVRDRIRLYWDRLFADPFEVEINNEKKTFFVHRTNNIMEQQFRSFAYGYRRIHGNSSIRRNLEHIPDAVPLVVNLKNPAYVKLVFNDISKIAKRFSEVDVVKIRNVVKAHNKAKNKNMSRNQKKLLRKTDLNDKLSIAFAHVAKPDLKKSN